VIVQVSYCNWVRVLPCLQHFHAAKLHDLCYIIRIISSLPYGPDVHELPFWTFSDSSGVKNTKIFRPREPAMCIAHPLPTRRELLLQVFRQCIALPYYSTYHTSSPSFVRMSHYAPHDHFPYDSSPAKHSISHPV